MPSATVFPNPEFLTWLHPTPEGFFLKKSADIPFPVIHQAEICLAEDASVPNTMVKLWTTLEVPTRLSLLRGDRPCDQSEH